MGSTETLAIKDRQNAKPSLDLKDCMIRARREHGKSLPAQVREMIQLSRGNGKIRRDDYYYFQLYDDEKYTAQEKSRFLSECVHFDIIQKCCDVRWWAAADDKFLAYMILSACGVAVPETQAIFTTSPRSFGRVAKLHTHDDLAGFLRSHAGYPLFAKTLGGAGSFGAHLINACHGDELELFGGETISLDDFTAQLSDQQDYIFQTVLQPHPALRQFGETVSTVRIILIFDESKPQILHTVWKIPAGGNFADNFWRDGNMLGSVNPDTGVIERVVRGIGPQLEEITHHCDTGARLQGFELPYWREIRDLCLNHAGIFGGIRYQSWDVAICPDGPVAVEVNTGSAFNLSQLATGKGFLTEQFSEFLTSNGYRLKTRH